MDQGLVGLDAMSALFAIFLVYSLVSGRTLTGFALTQVTTRKDKPALYWFTICLAAGGLCLLLCFAVPATAAALGHPIFGLR